MISLTMISLSGTHNYSVLLFKIWFDVNVLAVMLCYFLNISLFKAFDQDSNCFNSKKTKQKLAKGWMEGWFIKFCSFICLCSQNCYDQLKGWQVKQKFESA
jgi:hypothetical protein